MTAAIGMKIRYLKDDETAEILGYEIRAHATYLIVANGRMERKINILHEGRVFEVVGGPI